VFAFTCPPDSVRSGTTCIDKYEASVWQTTDAPTIAKIKDGTVTLANLLAGGATQLGLAPGDLAAAGCPATGNGCTGVYAVSIPGVEPAHDLTWFQAAAAAHNAGKRLPTNAEWHAAALGTPDGATCIVDAAGPVLTGTAGCVSDAGAFDMVGNLWEWVADWTELHPGAGPIALIRGGSFFLDVTAVGVFAVIGVSAASNAEGNVGIRAAR